MERKKVRVVHYLNQFFGGVGAEDKADSPPFSMEGPIGPGKFVQQQLGENGDVVATVICGDNYFAERIEDATDEVLESIATSRPDAVLAGPAFFAGRYGVACGALCKAVQERLGVPAVTGMYQENPGVDLYRRDVYIVETGTSATNMGEVLTKMLGILDGLSKGLKIDRPSAAGYFPRGILVNESTEETSAERAIEMLMAKVEGRPYQSEVALPTYDRVTPARGIGDLSQATIALVTDGGLVPKGNPDRIEVERATRFGGYDVTGLTSLSPGAFEANHAGYTGVFVDQDPNRLVPLDVMRDLEEEGRIGKLHNRFYSTSGCASIIEYVKRMGRTIARELKEEGVQAAILTST